jgi:hypothetical protein
MHITNPIYHPINMVNLKLNSTGMVTPRFPFTENGALSHIECLITALVPVKVCALACLYGQARLGEVLGSSETDCSHSTGI